MNLRDLIRNWLGLTDLRAELQDIHKVACDLLTELNTNNDYLDTLTTKIDFAAVPEDNEARVSASQRINQIAFKKMEAEQAIRNKYGY